MTCYISHCIYVVSFCCLLLWLICIECTKQSPRLRWKTIITLANPRRKAKCDHDTESITEMLKARFFGVQDCS